MPDEDLVAVAYDKLYSEIHNNSNVIANVFTIAIVAAAAIISAGVEFQEPGVFLATFVVLIPALNFITSQMESTARIGAYIAIRFETEESGVRWERDLMQLRRRESQHGHRRQGRYTQSVRSLFAIIGAVCLILPWNYIDGKDAVSITLIGGFSAVALVLLWQAYTAAGRALEVATLDRHLETWRSIGPEPNGRET